MKCAQTLEVGAYVLGALSPGERDAFERHLGECAICRDEVADLAVLPGLLGRLDAATAMAVARDGEEYSIPPGLLADLSDESAAWAEPTARAGWVGPVAGSDDTAADGSRGPRWAGPTVTPEPAEPADPPAGRVVSLIDAAARRRTREQRRNRLVTVGAALVAACLAVAVGLGVPRLLREDAPAMTAMNRVAATVPITAELGFRPTKSGTKVIMHCAYQGAGSDRWTFRLVVLTSAGEAEEVGNWTAGYGDEFQLTAPTKIKSSEIRRVEVRSGDGTVLLKLDL